MDLNRSIPHCVCDESCMERGLPIWQMLQFRFSFHSFSNEHNGVSKGISKAVLNWFKLAPCHKAVCSQVSQRWLAKEKDRRIKNSSRRLVALAEAPLLKGPGQSCSQVFSEDVFFSLWAKEIVIMENKQLSFREEENMKEFTGRMSHWQENQGV